MTVELARTQVMLKPWGITEPGPWTKARHVGGRIGEIWYEASGETASDQALLLKLLFTSQPLSLQVHPDDSYARSKGLGSGKTEAWYVLNAEPGAAVALGLRQHLTEVQLRQAVDDGSIAGRAAWHAVSAGDVVSVPAGTIHAIGAGLVIAEIQQRSDATYRLFDYGRQRELHVDDAIAVADTVVASGLARPTRLDHERTILVRSPHFVWERLEFAPDQTWWMDAERETWLLAISGSAIAGSFGLEKGDAIVARAERVGIRVGTQGLVALVAYTGDSPATNLLTRSRPMGSMKRTCLQQAAPAAPATITPTSNGPQSGLFQ